MDGHAGDAWTLAEGPGTYGAPVVSPDGTLVAYTQTAIDADGYYVPAAVYVRALAPNAEEVCVSGSIDRSVGSPVWTLDGSALLLAANDVNLVSMWKQPVDLTASTAPAAEKVALGNVSPSSVVPTADGGAVFIGKTADRPAELYVTSCVSGAEDPERLTNYNEFSATILELGEVGETPALFLPDIPLENERFPKTGSGQT
jgi:Tol biopolymer transport system component